MTLARIKRLVQLQRVVEGKPTDRTPAEILAAEKLAASQYPVKVKVQGPAETPPAPPESQ